MSFEKCQYNVPGKLTWSQIHKPFSSSMSSDRLLILDITAEFSQHLMDRSIILPKSLLHKQYGHLDWNWTLSVEIPKFSNKNINFSCWIQEVFCCWIQPLYTRPRDWIQKTKFYFVSLLNSMWIRILRSNSQRIQPWYTIEFGFSHDVQ